MQQVLVGKDAGEVRGQWGKKRVLWLSSPSCTPPTPDTYLLVVPCSICQAAENSWLKHRFPAHRA